jgi:hypothetical protein
VAYHGHAQVTDFLSFNLREAPRANADKNESNAGKYDDIQSKIEMRLTNERRA